jgi:Ca-activated chloride channel family protein
MAAAAAFVRASKPDDELFLMNFADKAGLEVPFTSDRSLLESGIARVDAVGGTALRDAIAKAEAYLSSGASRERKALLLVSDGNDNARGTSRDVIVQQAEHGDIAIYALGLQAEGDSARARRGRDALDDLSERTGGSAHFPSGADDIEPVAAASTRSATPPSTRPSTARTASCAWWSRAVNTSRCEPVPASGLPPTPARKRRDETTV